MEMGIQRLITLVRLCRYQRQLLHNMRPLPVQQWQSQPILPASWAADVVLHELFLSDSNLAPASTSTTQSQRAAKILWASSLSGVQQKNNMNLYIVQPKKNGPYLWNDSRNLCRFQCKNDLTIEFTCYLWNVCISTITGKEWLYSNKCSSAQSSFKCQACALSSENLPTELQNGEEDYSIRKKRETFLLFKSIF